MPRRTILTFVLALTLLLKSGHSVPPLGYFYGSASPSLSPPKTPENCSEVRKQFSEGYILLSEFMLRIQSCSETLSFGRNDLVQPKYDDMFMAAHPHFPNFPAPLKTADFSQSQPYAYSLSPAFSSTPFTGVSPWPYTLQSGAFLPSLNSNYEQAGKVANMGSFEGGNYFNPVLKQGDFRIASTPPNPDNIMTSSIVTETPTPLRVRKVFVTDRDKVTQDQIIDSLISQTNSILDKALKKNGETHVARLSHLNSVTRPTFTDRQIALNSTTTSQSQNPLRQIQTPRMPAKTKLYTPITATVTKNDDLDMTSLGLQDDASFLDAGPKTLLAAKLTLSNIDTLTSQLLEARSRIRSSRLLTGGQINRFIGGTRLSKDRTMLDQIMTKLGSTAGPGRGKQLTPVNLNPVLAQHSWRFPEGSRRQVLTVIKEFGKSPGRPDYGNPAAAVDKDPNYDKLKLKLLVDIKRRQMLLKQLERKKLMRTRGEILFRVKDAPSQPTRNVEISPRTLPSIFKQIGKRNRIPNDLPKDSSGNLLRSKSKWTSQLAGVRKLTPVMSQQANDSQQGFPVHIGRRKLFIPMIRFGLRNGNMRE